MKKYVIISATLLIMLSGCTNLHTLTSEQFEDVVPTEEQVTETIETTRHSNLNKFIEKYNGIATTPITDTFEIDIHSNEYYRTEFRLGAYDNAPALKGYIGKNTIELVNSYYDSAFGSDLRIYAFVYTLEEATDVFESFCKVSNAKITQSDLDDFYTYHDLDSGDCRIVLKDISGYVMKKNDGYDILLDGEPDYFDE